MKVEVEKVQKSGRTLHSFDSKARRLPWTVKAEITRGWMDLAKILTNVKTQPEYTSWRLVSENKKRNRGRCICFDQTEVGTYRKETWNKEK
jgi:hypothetical protein